MNTNKTLPPLEDVIYALAVTKDIPDAGVLDDFIRQYPEYASELTDFAVELALDSFEGEDESDDFLSNSDSVNPSISRVLSNFQNRLFEFQKKSESQSKTIKNVDNPFSKLDQSSFRALAKSIRGNNLFLMRLRERQIDPHSFTQGFLDFLSEKMAVSEKLLTTYFSAPQQIHTGQYFSSEDKPAIGKQLTFEEAISTSGLSEEDKEFLRSL